MSTVPESAELQAIAAQASDHLACVAALFGGDAPPDVPFLKQAVGATRALRGSASLLGLDPFQALLGRVLQLLEDAETGTVPWSARVEAALRELHAAESDYAHWLGRGDPHTANARLERADLESPSPGPGAAVTPSAGEAWSPWAEPALLASEIEQVVHAVQHLRQLFATHGVPAAEDPASATLRREVALLDACFRTPHGEGAQGAETTQEGLRNHCEGALHHLVEAAAQEVLDEARERGLRLALRVTGALEPIDEPLGAALLEILAHLWSDCLDAQARRSTPRIDTVLRAADHRVVVEIRDEEAREKTWRAARSDDDVLGRCPGLRRTRPLVEGLGGLVEVEPVQHPGCRFRLTLPLATEQPHVALIRVGQHDIALPASAVDAVHEAEQVHAAQDAAGPFVEVDGTRVPVLHLAFLLGDVSFDELAREHVVVVGSCERRAALFASNARRTAVGTLQGASQGLWAGAVETAAGRYPLLHVGALLGRCTPANLPATGSPPPPGKPAHRGPGLVLVVDSATPERERLAAILSAEGYAVQAVQSADEAWGLLESAPVDVLLCDLRLPEMNAQQIAERRAHSGRHAEVPLVLVLAHAGEQSHLVVQQLGASSWVRSPADPSELLACIGQHAVRSSQVRVESRSESEIKQSLPT